MAGTTAKMPEGRNVCPAASPDPLGARLFGRIGADALVLRIWLLLVLFNIFVHRDAIALLQYPDPDDAMRLAQVRDLIAGQGWFDIKQYRVNPVEGGGLMHWSRFVDAWIAGSVLALQPLLGDAVGERWALAFYPLLLILPLLLLLRRILTELGDKRLVVAGLLIACTGVTFLQFFTPMRIDHHNWQLLLSLAIFWLALRPPSLANGLAAAAIITLHMEISLEGLPYLVIFGALFAVDWLRDPRTAPRLAGFTGGLALFPWAWLLAMRGPSSAATVFCDSFSLPYAAAVAASAAVLAGWLRAPVVLSATLARRLAALALAGAVGMATFLLLGQACLSGPFGALDPLVRSYWYDMVYEGRPIWTQKASYAAVYLAPTLVGLAALAVAWRAARDGSFAENWTRAAPIILAVAFSSLFVTRMGASAHAFLIPAFAAMALGFWQWSRARRSLPGRVASVLLVFTALPSIDAALGVMLARAAAGAPLAASGKGAHCPTAETLAALAGEPSARLFAPIDIGPALLIRTPHSVVATGHHRNHNAMHRIITAFLADPDAAEPIVRAERANYLVACIGLPEMDRFAKDAPRGLAAHIVRGEPVAWLRLDPRLSSPTVRVYRIAAMARAPTINPNRH